ncbi:C-C chemokine receptor 1-like protein 1 [Grammomys surdaster]|uniref:C-C chemokine receptor 1-like protein 1 n=1 Tax=Grammomys surdaster TaxID=491861 RepID=UPI00109FCE9B|nr:C-C chemokine receptor 1-like protein 1 [Grammomys surdaster]XP_028617475.1 C-C chemokine receptor 1-like protein 1 [Grammomys surdaster]
MESPAVTEPSHNTDTEDNFIPALLCFSINVRAFGITVLTPLYSLVFVIGVIGNVLVVLVLIQHKRLRNMTSIYLFNLAISDLVFLSTLPFWVDYIMKGDWVFGNAMCKFLSGFYYLGLYSDMFFIILLTIDRYLAVVHAVFALKARTVTFGIISSIITWVLATLVSIPCLYVFKSQMEFTYYTCKAVLPRKSLSRFLRFQALTMNILGLILPLLAMIICYTKIIIVLHRRPNKKKAKAMRLIFVITLLFFLLLTPYYLAAFVSAFEDVLFTYNCLRSQQVDLSLMITEALAYTHCCVNPIIYVFVGERFRKYLWQLFRRHTAVSLPKWLPFVSMDRAQRASATSPSTGEIEVSADL